MKLSDNILSHIDESVAFDPQKYAWGIYHRWIGEARRLEAAIQESDQRYSDLQDLHLEALQCNLKLVSVVEIMRIAIDDVRWVTTLPPAAMNDDEGFYRRELQRCIGDAARAHEAVKKVEDNDG